MQEKRPYIGTLGAEWSRERTVFRLWAPSAEAVTLCLEGEEYRMVQDGSIWICTVPGDQDGRYYTYRIRRSGALFEVPDLFARACGVNGRRSMVIDLRRTDPPGFADGVTLAAPTDAVICELHLRDVSMHPSGRFERRGRYLSLTEQAVNSAGEPVGLRYFREQGFTHLHLLPVLDFASIDESLPDGGYNWGYDPMHYFIPEGSYATDAADGAVRIRELKALIHAAHQEGLGVVLDVVFNHTFLGAESAFERTEPGYFHRRTGEDWANGSGCGNEIASEMPMMRRMIVESLCYFATEYRVDGFRFDLMGLMDIETLRLAEKRLREINPSILLYGEGWTGGLSPLDPALRAEKGNARKLRYTAMFSDDFRDTVKGSVFADTACGYINGDHSPEMASRLKAALCGGVAHPAHGRETWTDSPAQSINYTECHDNLTFHDKLRLSMPGADQERLLRAERMGAALICLSQGIPFFGAGQEFLRSKALPEGGFDHNSYRSPDAVNALNWDDLTEHRALAEYYRGLLAIRRTFPEFRLRDGESVRAQLRFTDLEDGAMTVQIGRFLLVLNPLDRDLSVQVTGEVFADAERAAAVPLYPVQGTAVCRAQSIQLLKTQ